MTLSSREPREQSGRDSFGRYRAQVRSAAMASLAILEGEDVDRVYCDLHDDFVVRKKNANGVSYLFYQVKTKGKQNHNWTVNELFGLKSRIKDQSKQSTAKVRDSFVGKLLLHTIVFDEYCNSVVFQTNIHNDDNIEALHKDITSGTFENKFTKVLIERFNELFPEEIDSKLSIESIKERLSKLEFETDVQYLKDGADNFEPLARSKIYDFSEVDLSLIEVKEILMKILDLVERKSSGVITDWTEDSIEKLAGISIDDLLAILSISKDAYKNLREGGDRNAIKNVSIIQRTLSGVGANDEQIEYCSRCKSKWDLWHRKNRHVIPEFKLQSITGEIRDLLYTINKKGDVIRFSDFHQPIQELVVSLDADGDLYDLNEDLILGGVFAQLVRGNS